MDIKQVKGFYFRYETHLELKEKIMFVNKKLIGNYRNKLYKQKEH